MTGFRKIWREELVFLQMVYRYIAEVISRPVASTGISPNTITIIGFLCGVAASALFFLRSDKWQLSGILLMNLALISDYLDGTVARLQGKSSRYGFWLDTVLDRITDFVIFFGAAAGASKTGIERIWFWVSISIGLRYLFDILRWSPSFTGFGKNVKEMVSGRNRFVSSFFYSRPNLYFLLAITVIIDQVYYFFVLSSFYGLIFTVALFFYLNRDLHRVR